MGLTIYWTKFAKYELKNIFDYYNRTVSLKIANKITKQIITETNILSKFPKVGVIEDLLQDGNFRYLISTNYKIIYRINYDKNRIEIIDVFDTRQNPTKINRNK